jgi:hypothetical protein
MELIEKLPIQKINFLSTLSFNDFKTLNICKSDCKNNDDRLKNYNRLMEFCKAMKKGKGEMKRIYAFTDPTPLEVGGRLYSGLSIQGLSSKVRGFLCDEIMTDIDMKNAHPAILRYICKEHNIPCPNLEYYINNRDTILIDYGDEGKVEFLKCINSDKTNKKIKDKFFKDFDKECKYIQGIITKLPEYKHISNSVPNSRLYNWLGSAINRILCVYENKILQSAISVMARKNIEIGVLMFDGLMIYGNYYNNFSLLEEIENEVESAFEGLNMKFAYKEHKTGFIEMPEDFCDVTNEPKLTKDFETVAKKFEETHCKIINKGVFIKTYGTDNIVMNKQMIKTSYEHLVYESFDKNGNIDEKNFINTWLNNNPKQRCYDDIGVYPPNLECPKTHYNMWRPFEMENVTEWVKKDNELAIIRAHIKILCDNDDIIFDYFEKWIAQMIQYPAIKSICPTLISKQGAGKGTLLELLKKMLGSSKVFETAEPSRDVWGDFNGRMANTFLINLDELSKKETIESEGKIKSLITSPSLTINNKGVNQYDIQSFHRFLITTNKEEPINTSVDDRRNFIIRSSDELCGNKEYFISFYKMLDDVNVIKTCYEYFKSIPGMDRFGAIPIPKTEYQEDLKELSINPIEEWIKSFVTDYDDDNMIPSYLCTDLFRMFKDWCNSSTMSYNCNMIQFFVRLKRLNLDGVEKKHTNKGNKTTFDIKKLQQHYGVGCLL